MAPIGTVSKLAPGLQELLPDAEAREHPIQHVVRRHHADQVIERAHRRAQVRGGRGRIDAAASRRVERFDLGQGALQGAAVPRPRDDRLHVAQRYQAAGR